MDYHWCFIHLRVVMYWQWKFYEGNRGNDRGQSTLSGAVFSGLLRSVGNDRSDVWNCGSNGGCPTLYGATSDAGSKEKLPLFLAEDPVFWYLAKFATLFFWNGS